MIMRLTQNESMQYLHDKGFEISVPQFYRLKKTIQQSRFDRLSLIAKSQFVAQHLERIDQLELINSEYWKLYRDTKDTFKKALILEKIAELQTYISPYYDASRYILEKSITRNEIEKNSPLSTV